LEEGVRERQSVTGPDANQAAGLSASDEAAFAVKTPDVSDGARC
jgi:hypothetical protein